MPRPIKATISASAFRNNLSVVRGLAPDAKVWAVLKANGYGHGLLRAASGLASADGFAVIEIEHAVQLRDEGYAHPILLLQGFFTGAELDIISEHRLIPVIHNAEQIAMLAAAYMTMQLSVYFKINTGMNRLGFPPDAVPAALSALMACPCVGNITLMTHFANADSDSASPRVAEQLGRFNDTVGNVALPKSLANSSAIISHSQTHADWVRPGIMLYGGSPFGHRLPDHTAEALGLEPVMTFSSEIIDTQQLATGDRVGYGGTFVASAPMRVGTVACGYADGYPRHAGTGTPILVNGRRTQTLGRVSMDMLSVDLSGIPEAKVGSPVTMWGEGLPADEVAEAAGTISYELFCGVTQRVPLEDI